MQIYYAQYNQMSDFETEYIFCKDNRLVLIVDVYLQRLALLMLELKLLKLRPLYREHHSFALKHHTQNQHVLAHTRGLHGLKTEARTRPVPEIVWPNPTRPERHG